MDLQACQMAIDLLDDEDEDDFYDGVGAASVFQEMVEADVQLLA